MENAEPLPGKSGRHFQQHVTFAALILQNYDGSYPFHLYLKSYFSSNKKHGSKDRKIITALCYNYFRVAHALLPSLDLEDKILLANYLTENKSFEGLQTSNVFKNRESFKSIGLETFLDSLFSINNIFPFPAEVSGQIDFDKFGQSFLVQPRLFIRTRPGYSERIEAKLKKADISFERINKNCLSFSNAEKLNNIIQIDTEAVIQDYSSQQTLNLLNKIPGVNEMKTWDCCAASGGKSILAFDLFPGIQLTVSDTRKSILFNLQKRFHAAGIKNYQSFVFDLSVSHPSPKILNQQDLIIADVPCSGSGTWSRTPEQLLYFAKNRISEYAELQRRIVSNAVKSLQPGGYLLYITCSVFKKENEENVRWMEKELSLLCLDIQYYIGYEMQADTLFAALFQKRNYH